MKVTGVDRGAVRRNPGIVWRDLVLAVGLVGICAAGLMLFFKAAQAAGSRGSGVVAAVLVALGALGVLSVGLSTVTRDVSFFRLHGRDVQRDSLVPAPAAPDIGGEALDHTAVDADGFEHTVAALCARDGCTPVEVVGGAGDLGADVVAVTVDGLRVVLQCKHYAPDNRVGSQDLQRFGGTCFTIHEADVAVVVTTSSFTAPALEYAATCGIVCVDGEALGAWTDQITPAPWAAPVTDPTAPVSLSGPQ
ncbi:restriction endonuclease [Streptomyces sp. NPDC006553]|uniref:restriction endonuclease n=1 Tax=unclassified Streptomyces TaxID=2593676 RepID=UPI00224E4B0D|nr:restriction endonuclease [Streptomyces sp. NBC_00233]MCX5231281.1 restriction endonuclease [Streptomyces sp. NBC_00233]